MVENTQDTFNYAYNYNRSRADVHTLVGALKISSKIAEEIGDAGVFEENNKNLKSFYEFSKKWLSEESIENWKYNRMSVRYFNLAYVRFKGNQLMERIQFMERIDSSKDNIVGQEIQSTLRAS